MAISIVCPQCGAESSNAGVFCPKCGARMGTPDIQNRREPFPIFRMLGYVVRAVVILIIVVGIGLILWPVTVPPIEVDGMKAEKFDKGLAELQKVVQQKGTALPEVKQPDLNNYLMWRVQQTAGADTAQGMQMALNDLRVYLSPTQVKALTVGGWGPVKISFEATGKPVVENGHFSVTVTGARLGHLKLPHQSWNWAAGKIELVLSGFDRERFILDNARRIEMGEQWAKIHLGR